VPLSTIQKCGALDDPKNPWTGRSSIVGNGPFILKEWKIIRIFWWSETHILGRDTSVRLNSIYFVPVENQDTGERMFRSGQLHTQDQAPRTKSPFSARQPGLLADCPMLGAPTIIGST